MSKITCPSISYQAEADLERVQFFFTAAYALQDESQDALPLATRMET